MDITANCGTPGYVILPHGSHEYTITTPGQQPLKVYLSITDEGLPVCGGGQSKGTANVTEGGFTIYVDVNSNSATVDYIAY